MSVAANLSKSPAIAYAVLGVVAIVAFVVVENALKAAAKTGVDAAKATGNAVAGIATGNNAATAGTEYAGTGALGTLGAVTDKIFGGGLSTFGDWIGSQLPGSGNDYDPNANNNPPTTYPVDNNFGINDPSGWGDSTR